MSLHQVFSILTWTGYWAELLFKVIVEQLGNIKVTDLDFADDVAILSESLESLEVALNAFSNKRSPWV